MPITMLLIIKMTNIKNWTFLKVFLLALYIPVILLDASSTFVCHFENYVINAHIYLHLSDAFIQSELQCIQIIHVLSACVFPGNQTHKLCAANAML